MPAGFSSAAGGAARGIWHPPTRERWDSRSSPAGHRRRATLLPCPDSTHGDMPPLTNNAVLFAHVPTGFASGAWDAGGVSHPELVDLEDGRWYLYYSGFPERPAGEGGTSRQGSSLGVAMATGNDLTSWTRVAV